MICAFLPFKQQKDYGHGEHGGVRWRWPNTTLQDVMGPECVSSHQIGQRVCVGVLPSVLGGPEGRWGGRLGTLKGLRRRRRVEDGCEGTAWVGHKQSQQSLNWQALWLTSMSPSPESIDNRPAVTACVSTGPVNQSEKNEPQNQTLIAARMYLDSC